MRSYIDWLNEEGFYISSSYDGVDGWAPGGKLKLIPIQERVLGHAFTPNKDGSLPYKIVVISSPKKSGKTTMTASVVAWYAEECQSGSQIYCIANKLEQAQGRVYLAVDYHNRIKGMTEKDRTKYVTYYENGTTLTALPSEARTVAGVNPALSSWDELWGATNEGDRLLWAEMTTPAVQNPLRIVSSYAGYMNESKLLWDIYEKIVLHGEPVPELADIVDEKGNPVCFRNGKSFAYWDTVARMPWQTEEYYKDEVDSGMRPSDFLREHRNTWVTSNEAFIDIKLWDDAVKRGEEAGLTEPVMYRMDHPYRRYPIAVAVDAGIKHDCTAIVGAYWDRERGRIGIAFHYIWTPAKNEPIDLESTVEAFLLKVWNNLNISIVGYDPTQLHRSMTTLRGKGLRCIEFIQNERMMTKASRSLYDALSDGVLEAYPNDELRSHLQFAVAKNTAMGFRLTKEAHAKYKIDGATAMAMAVDLAISQKGVDASKPIHIWSPFSDNTAVKRKPVGALDESRLPPEFRS